MKKAPILLCLVLVFQTSFSQDYSKIDSLRKAFNNTKIDTVKGQIVFAMMTEYVALSQDSMEAFTDKIFRIVGNNDKIGQARVCRYAANAYRNNGKVAMALAFTNKELEIYRELNDKAGEGRCLSRIVSIYSQQNMLPEAVNALLPLLDMYKELGDTLNMGRTLFNLSGIYYKIENFPKALEYQLKVLDYIKVIGEDKVGLEPVGAVNNDIAITYIQLKNYEKGLEHLLKAKKISETLKDTGAIAMINNNIGEIYFLKNDYNLALEYYSKALDYQKKSGYDISMYAGNVGATYNKLKLFRTALDYCKESYKNALEQESGEAIKFAAENLTDCYEGLGDLASAYKYYKIFNAYKDSLDISANKGKIMQIEMQNGFKSELQAQELIQKQKDEKMNAELKQQKMMRNFAVGGIVLLVFGLFFAVRSYNIKRKSNILLAAQKKEIEDKNMILHQQKEHIEMIHQEVSQSIDYAKRIQSSIFPNESILANSFPDHFILFHPKDRVSGDFFWWAGVEDSIVIAVADCTGHGVPGAFMSMLGISFLREIVTKEYVVQPDVILRKLRKEIINTLNQEGRIGEQKDGLDIALISINLQTKLMQFAGANNPVYIMRDGNITEIKADKMPISIYDRMEKFTNNEYQLNANDNIYLFSDGFADQFGGENMKKFKYKPFQELLVSVASKPMPEQKEIIDSTFLGWKKSVEQTDDVLVVGIRV